MAVVQTLGTVHGLVGDVRVIMESTQRFPDLLVIFSERCYIRWQGVYTFVLPIFYLSLPRLTVPCR